MSNELRKCYCGGRRFASDVTVEGSPLTAFRCLSCGCVYPDNTLLNRPETTDEMLERLRALDGTAILSCNGGMLLGGGAGWFVNYISEKGRTNTADYPTSREAVSAALEELEGKSDG